MINKVCTKCNIEKPVSEFSKDNSRVSKYKSHCKKCDAARRKQYFKDNLEKERNRLNKYAQTAKGRYNNLKKSAKNRKINMELTFEEFVHLDKQPCRYCHSEKGSYGYGLDRIDSNKGYTLKNVVSCCGICNTIKMHSDITDDKLINRLELMIKNLKEVKNNG